MEINIGNNLHSLLSGLSENAIIEITKNLNKNILNEKEQCTNNCSHMWTDIKIGGGTVANFYYQQCKLCNFIRKIC